MTLFTPPRLPTTEQLDGPLSPLDGKQAISEVDFATIAGHVHRATGIVITPAKRSMLVSRISRRLHHLGLDGYAAYAALIDSPAGEREREALISAITTNVTSFFREPHHFSSLRDMLPDLIGHARAGARIRLWSAGCSTGQEAYSIAMTILDHAPEAARYDLRILATDIDPQVIATARRGIYPTPPPDALPQLARYSQKSPNADEISIVDAPRALIRFEVLNLLDPWPFEGRFDVIFCRNVVIYFDVETRLRLWTRFAERLLPGGVLFLGHSERMHHDLDACFAPMGVTQYRRTATPSAR